MVLRRLTPSAAATTPSSTSSPAGANANLNLTTATTTTTEQVPGQPPVASTTVVTFGTTTLCGGGGGPNSPGQAQPDLAGIFSVVFNRNRQGQLQQQRHQVSPMAGVHSGTGTGPGASSLSLIMHPHPPHLHHHHGHGHGLGHHHDFGSSGRGSRWPSFSMSSSRSFWTKYCLLCTICGSAATILAGIFLIIAVLFRYYTTSIYYFETVPTYIPAILLSICGVSTIAFSCKRNRNIILLRITACWSLVSAALSSVITITTSLIHMNRLQTLKECVYNKNPPSCTCFGHSYGLESGLGIYNTNDVSSLSSSSASLSTNGNGGGATEPLHFVFENTADCDVIHGALYSCLRAVFAISVVAVLLSIFLCMLLYQLIGHERKKAYWSRIRRINSDWSTDFLACLPRTLPRERSGLMPLILTPPSSLGLGSAGPILHHLPSNWGPPPPYEASASNASASTSQDDLMLPPVRRTTFNAAPFLQPKPYHSASGMTSAHRFPGLQTLSAAGTNISSPSTPSSNSNLNAILTGSFPFSPTITSLSSLTSNTATTSAPLTGAVAKNTPNIPTSSSASSSFYHPNLHDQGTAPPGSSMDTEEENDERQFHLQQIKLDRRSNFVPPILMQKQVALRESKISISSDSDNLYSIEEDLFKEPTRDKDLEAKINNQIMQLLLLEEERDAKVKAAASIAGTATLAVMEDMSKSSSIVTLQNDDDEIEHDENLEDEKSSTIAGSRVISSLPSSPFLNNVKKYIRERTNSLRIVGSSPLFTRRAIRTGMRNYTALGTGAGGSLRDRLNCNPIPRTCHLNPNYSYDADEAENSRLMAPTVNNFALKSSQNGNVPEASFESATRTRFGSNPTISTKVLLKSRSLPGTPLKKLRRDRV